MLNTPFESVALIILALLTSHVVHIPPKLELVVNLNEKVASILQKLVSSVKSATSIAGCIVKSTESIPKHKPVV